MLTKEETATLRAFVVAKAKAYAAGCSYDDAAFNTEYATKVLAAKGIDASSLDVFETLEDLERTGLVEWHRPREAPGYWMPTSAAAREVL